MQAANPELITVSSQSQHRYIYLKDGRQLAYYEYGQADGFPIFYFHGWPSSALDGAVFHDAALRAGVRLIAVDRPGCGQSTFLANRTLASFPNDILQLANRLGFRRFSVLGQSGGGPYALACAYHLNHNLVAAGVAAGMFSRTHPITVQNMQMYPDRIAFHLVNRAPFLLRPMMAFNSLLLRVMPPDTLLKALIAEMPEKDRAAFEKPEIIESMKNVLKHLRTASSAGAAQDARVIMGDWGFDLASIQTKVHLWHGEADNSVPVQASGWYASQLPNHALNIYLEEGHGVLFNHAVEALTALSV